MNCKCGCGEKLDFALGRKNKKYIHGHAVRINNAGARARMGISPWNLGIPRTDKERKRISSGRTGIPTPHSDAWRLKMSNLMKGRKIYWMDKIVKSRKSNPNYDSIKKKISETLKKKYKNEELVSPFYIDGRYKNDPKNYTKQYGGNFTNSLKNEIRKRDLCICQECNRFDSRTCHHIDENKKNNKPENLIVLCKTCHVKFHRSSKDVKKIKTKQYNKKLKNEN